MNTKPVDITKKSNIKCEHCRACDKSPKGYWCALHEKEVNYWNRCKFFKYDLKYIKKGE